MADAEEQDLKEVYNETIKSLVPINELSPQLQNEVIRNCDIYKSKKKALIFKQGARDGHSFYLLDGQIELLSNDQVQSIIVSGTDGARYAMVRLQPRQFSARAKTEVTILQIERSALDRLMVADQQKKPEAAPASVVMEVSHIDDEDSGDWMTKMLQSELFSRLPTANIHQLFALLEPVEFKTGDAVIKQGDAGDFYYIIQEGRCEVTRAPTPGAKPIKLAELKAGDCFGEEALLTNATRNASITMKTDGILMQLSKDNFINLIKKPTLEEVNYANAQKLVEQGAVWLDVRFPNEYEESKIEGSINISLNALRMQTDKLKQDKKYIIYCDTGGRSSAAAFLLTDRGFKVSYLKDGLSSVPPDSVEKKAPAAAAKVEKKAPQPAAAPVAVPVPDEEEDADLDTEIRSSIIETNLAKTNLELEAAKKKLAESEKADNAAINEARKKLEAEKKKLEAEKKSAEKETQKLRDQEAENIKKLKREAEERLTEEKKKLEEVYANNTAEMEKLQRMKQEAEEHIRKEREKLEKEAAAAKKKHQEAEKLKQQLEASRQALDKEAEKKRAEQEAMAKAIQAKAKVKLEQERRKMADEFARTNEELGKAQKGMAMAEAARTAAQQEAKNIIEEYKKQFDQERARDQARLQEERKKLEEESRKIRQTLQDIQKSKQQAEATEAEAQAEVRQLRQKQKGEDVTQNKDIQKLIEEQIKAVEARMLKAKENVESAKQAEEDIDAVRVLNEEEIKKQKEIEERMRGQIESDLASFVAEHQKEEEGKVQVIAHSDHIKRIKERAAAAKKATEQSTDNLFSDIASQLGKDDKN